VERVGEMARGRELETWSRDLEDVLFVRTWSRDIMTKHIYTCLLFRRIWTDDSERAGEVVVARNTRVPEAFRKEKDLKINTERLESAL
jgi:hypothetical protein